MPTKTELLIEKSNFHRIRNFEKMNKMKEDMEEKTKQKTIVPVPTKENTAYDDDGDLSPLPRRNSKLSNAESSALLPLIKEQQE